MGHSKRLFADSGGLTEHDVAQLAMDGLAAPTPAPRPPIDGVVLRNGQRMPYTLDAANLASEPRRLFPEQFVMAGLLLASFIAPICHLLG